MRTVKTALAVLVCMAVFVGMGFFIEINSFDLFLALTAAVICMQDSVKNSIVTGLSRLEGTVIGALLGMGALYIENVLPYIGVQITLVVVGTIVLIVVCNLLDINKAIVMGCVVFYIIALQTSPELSPLVSSVHRFLDTVVGVIIAVAINRLIRNPDKIDIDDEDNEGNDPNSPRT